MSKAPIPWRDRFLVGRKIGKQQVEDVGVVAAGILRAAIRVMDQTAVPAGATASAMVSAASPSAEPMNCHLKASSTTAAWT